MAEIVEVTLDRVAKGGAALGPGPDGRVVFVRGALPGERVLASVRADKKGFLDAELSQVLDASPSRVEPSCKHVADGCGGCDWQHANGEAQSTMRLDIVADALRRLGKLDGIDIRQGPMLPGTDYRTTVRVAVSNGLAGYRKGRSHDVVRPETCAVAHPLVEEILVDGRFPDAADVTIKVGARTGDRLAVVGPNAEGSAVPIGTQIIGRDDLKAGRTAHIHEIVGGHRFRISADSFFQCRPDGAEALLQLAADALADVDGPLVDAYCGVGLFGAIVAEGRPLTAIESSRSSILDAAENLPKGTEIVRSRVERWTPTKAAGVIADPARRGLEAAGVGVVTATEASTIVLVSCDPASLARDARLIVDRGYALDRVTVVDLFGQTSHVETVSVFRR